MENNKSEILFEKFEIKACLKKNSFSAVYLARHIFLEKDIFLKALNTKNLPDPSLLVRFKREAKILARLDHPNIIKVLDFGNYRDFFYISFEYFRSNNLRFWLQKKALTSAQKKYLAGQLIKALCFAHSQGIIHRDLKPENILIDNHLNLKVADFGLALVEDESRITEAQSLVGTPAYMSPEQIRGEPLSFQSDQFNLGIILFELFTGKNPFLGKDAGQTINKILNFSVEDIQQQLNKIPEDLQAPILQLLQKSPDKRFLKTDDLKSFFLPDELTDKERSKGRDSRKKIITAASILGLLIFVFLIFQFGSNSGKIEKQQISPQVQEILQPVFSQKDTESITDKNLLKSNQATSGLTKKKMEREKAAHDVSNTKIRRTTVKVSEPAHLIFDCFPWAEVIVDSQYHMTTPMDKALLLEAGMHSFVLKHPAFPEYYGKILLKPAEKKTLKFKLDTLFAYLNCQVHPWGGIYIDGQFIDQSPLKRPLPVVPGEHILTVKNEKFPEFCDTLILNQKDTLNLKINLMQNAGL